MSMVFKAVFTKSETQTIKHPQEKRIVLTSPTRETRKHRTFIPVEVFEEPAHLKRESLKKKFFFLLRNHFLRLQGKELKVHHLERGTLRLVK